MNKNLLSCILLIVGVISFSSIFVFKIDGFIGFALSTLGLVLCIYSLIIGQKIRDIFFVLLELLPFLDLN